MTLAEYGRQSFTEPLGSFHAYSSFQDGRDGSEFAFLNTHIEGSGNVGPELGLTAWQTCDGAYSHDFPVGMAQVITSENVSEQMGFQIIVRLGREGIIEGLP